MCDLMARPTSPDLSRYRPRINATRRCDHSVHTHRDQIGRSLSHVTHIHSIHDRDAAEVVKTSRPVEQGFRPDGRSYIVDVSPNRTIDNRIEEWSKFIDITDSESPGIGRWLSSIVSSSNDAIIRLRSTRS